jgi:hypothetical protein
LPVIATPADPPGFLTALAITPSSRFRPIIGHVSPSTAFSLVGTACAANEEHPKH